MSSSRPHKPWRVVLTGLPGHGGESDHTSQAKAYDFLRTQLTHPDVKALSAKVLHWEEGRWWHYETVHASELPSAAWTAPRADATPA